MRNNRSQFAGIIAGFAIGTFLFSAQIVAKKILLGSGDNLLFLACVSWLLAIMATYHVSTIYIRKRLADEGENRRAETCLIREQKNAIGAQLNTLMEENLRLRLTLGSAELDQDSRSDDRPIAINSATINRIYRAISVFPERYPDYESRPPKLDDDVRPWLHESGLVRDGAKGREAIVFGRIISEHFGFSPDTKNSQ